MATKRVLIIAYYFPPIAGIGSIRLSRFAQLLPDSGWEAEVVAPSSTPHPLDPGLDLSSVTVLRSRSIELSQLGKQLVNVVRRASPGPGSGMEAFARGAAHGSVFFPDAQIGWYPGAVAAGLRRAPKARFDAVFSSSFPITAHLAAWTISSRRRLPWLAEFRDPWADALPLAHRHRSRAARLERAIAGRASAVAMPTPTWAKHYGERWGVPVSVIPNGFDPLPALPPEPQRPTIVHLGSFYPGRQTLAPLWSTLRDWMAADPNGVPLMRVIGRLPPEAHGEIARHGLSEIVEETGMLPHREALAALGSASLLVLSGGVREGPVDGGWVPAKLFEYLATGIPIVLFGHRTSDAARLLAGEPGCSVIEPDDLEGAAEVIRTGVGGPRVDRAVSSLTRRAAAERLAGELDRIADTANRVYKRS